MPALLGNVSTDALVQQLWTRYNSFHESCRDVLDSVPTLVRTRLSNLNTLSLTLPDTDQYVVHGLSLDAFTIEDITLPSLVAFLALASLLLSLLLDFHTVFIRGGRRRRGNIADDSRRSTPLEALMFIAVPTHSRWSAYYTSVARHGLKLSHHEARMRVSLSQLISDIRSGAVELRCPDADLARLITGRLEVYGWKINLSLETTWNVDLMIRLAGARLACMLPQHKVKLPVSGVGNLSSNHTASQKETQTTAGTNFAHLALRSTRGQHVLMLDAVPYYQLTAYIRAFQTSLSPGASAMIGFSALGSSVQPDSDQFLLASLPFLPRKYIKQARSTVDLPPSARRTLTPLLTSFTAVLQLVASGTAPLAVESVQNVSDEYRGFLQEYVQELTYAPGARDEFVARWGMDGWREERLLGSWEAALFSSTVMCRWLVLVRR